MLRRAACGKSTGVLQVCNNLGQCHCDVGYAAPDCDSPGHGGSQHSGPIKIYEKERECSATIGPATTVTSGATTTVTSGVTTTVTSGATTTVTSGASGAAITLLEGAVCLLAWKKFNFYWRVFEPS